uniref:Uncharacterized protein n=1 Tax=Tanacetum cinerariifolium TaxID=118510 RepID=A0A6L2L8E3_TANCI|nr:hypothetical protein [Tanacetum cinerariifolium]
MNLHVLQEGSKEWDEQREVREVMDGTTFLSWRWWWNSWRRRHWEGVLMSSLVRLMNNCFGGMMLIFGLLECFEIEALVDAMEAYDG